MVIPLLEPSEDDIPLQNYDSKNPDHFSKLTHQLRKLRAQELQLTTTIHVTMKKFEKTNDENNEKYENDVKALQDQFAAKQIDENALKKTLSKLKTDFNSEARMLQQNYKSDLSELEEMLQGKLKEIGDMQNVLYSQEEANEQLTPAQVDKANLSHVKYARELLLELKQSEVEKQIEMGSLRQKHREQVESKIGENKEKLARLNAEMLGANKPQAEILLKIEELRVCQDKEMAEMLEKQGIEFTAVEGKLKTCVREQIAWEKAISSTNVESLTALYPLRRVPSGILGDDVTEEMEITDEVEIQMKKMKMRKLRMEEMNVESRIHDLFIRQNDYNSMTEKEQGYDFMCMQAHFLKSKEPEEKVLSQNTEFRKSQEAENDIIRQTQMEEFTVLLTEFKQKLLQIQELEEDLTGDDVNLIEGDVPIEKFNPRSREHLYNMQCQIRKLHEHEMDVMNKLHTVRVSQINQNIELLISHYDTFSKIQHQLAASDMSEEQVKAKSDAVKDTLEKDKEFIWEQQKNNFATVENAWHKAVILIAEVEMTIQKSAYNYKLYYEPLHKPPAPIPIPRPSPIMYSEYSATPWDERTEEEIIELEKLDVLYRKGKRKRNRFGGFQPPHVKASTPPPAEACQPPPAKVKSKSSTKSLPPSNLCKPPSEEAGEVSVGCCGWWGRKKRVAAAETTNMDEK